MCVYELKMVCAITDMNDITYMGSFIFMLRFANNRPLDLIPDVKHSKLLDTIMKA